MSFKKAFDPIKFINLPFGIIFFTAGLTVNLLQLILYIFLRPVSKPVFRKLNNYLTYSSFSLLIFLQQYWANVKVTIHSDKNHQDNYYGKEHALLIMNHSYEIDWLIGWNLCEHYGTLGNCKIFGKKSLQYIPGIGMSWRLGGSIFVERNWQKDQNVFQSKLKEMTEYTDPLWLLLAAEGTRFTKEKHLASLAFAKEHGLPHLRHHLVPRTKGFSTSIPHIRNKFKAIYNVNIGINPSSNEATLTNILHRKTVVADFFVERIPMEELPEGEAELSDWLHKLYKRKDDLLDCYLKTGSFRGAANKPYHSVTLSKKTYPLLNFIFWAVVVLVPFVYYIQQLLVSGNITYFGTAFGIIGSFIFLLDKIAGEAKMSRSSSYGTSKEFLKNYGVTSKK